MEEFWYGIAGGVIAQSAGTPQILRMLKTKRARDVSLTTFIMLLVGDVITFTYFIRNLDFVGLVMSILEVITVGVLIVITYVLRRKYPDG